LQDNRTYHLEALDCDAPRWIAAINERLSSA